MDDLISRQAAIDAVSCGCQEFRGIFARCEKNLNELPTAEKKGKWKIDVDCEYAVFDIVGERTWAIKATCSECGFAMRFIEGRGAFNYCPGCGAKMENKNNESDNT